MPLPLKWIKKTGWVNEYTLILNTKVASESNFFFEVTITEGEHPDSGTDPITFKLKRRDLGGTSIAEFQEKKMVEMAMISTFKDAHLNNKRVIVEGSEMQGPGNQKFNHVGTVTIKVS